MKSEIYEELRLRAYEYLTLSRFPGTKEHKKAKEIIKTILREKAIPFVEERFSVKKRVPVRAYLETNGNFVKAFPFVGSLSGTFEGYVKEDFIEGDIALQEAKSVNFELLKNKNVKALVCYLGSLDQIFYGAVHEDLAVVSIKRSELPKVKDFYVRLYVESKEEELRCSNIVFELGKGPVVYVIAHMDTKPETCGAVDNGLASFILPYLYQELKKDFRLPFKLRFLITDCEEIGLEGAKHHVSKGLKHAYYCINLDGIGWNSPVVIYRDSGGYNDHELSERFYRIARQVGLEVELKAVPSAKSDHIPFKMAGLKTLFLSSHPLPIRHTICDNYYAIDWQIAKLWFFAVLHFLKDLGKI
ncbi:M28 family peptidase [Thermocrinis jamiesonii]|jgi:Predicted aminopeptidases|uniref:M28 family peptidase n=1 Tax=Thermocrinis jamiesonii TaxID=1302351 RepID=UPI000494E551|nr:M28 family peptidase [Thermocrinis jamiesonii]